MASAGPLVRVEAEGALPAFLVRRHPRARRVRLRVTSRDGLVVTLPPRVPIEAAADAVRAHLGWALGHLGRIEERLAARALGADALLPGEVEFAATGERWRVEYAHSGRAGVRVTERPGVLRVVGAVDDGEGCLAALRRWLTRAARTRLLALLAEVSAAEGLAYSRAGVRAQRTRWGSCSRAGAVSLNRSLVFLAPGLVRCVLVHELVHTVFHDHSQAFWAELERRSPRASAARRALRDSWREVPPWADA